MVRDVSGDRLARVLGGPPGLCARIEKVAEQALESRIGSDDVLTQAREMRARLIEEGRKAQLKPVNITVQYLSAGKSQPSFAKGRITRLGRRNANIAVEAWQTDRDRPIATAIMNILMA